MYHTTGAFIVFEDFNAVRSANERIGSICFVLHKMLISINLFLFGVGRYSDG